MGRSRPRRGGYKNSPKSKHRSGNTSRSPPSRRHSRRHRSRSRSRGRRGISHGSTKQRRRSSNKTQRRRSSSSSSSSARTRKSPAKNKVHKPPAALPAIKIHIDPPATTNVVLTKRARQKSESGFPIGGLKVSRAGFDGPRGCFNCGESGHMARECPVSRSTGLGVKRPMEVNREIGDWQELNDRASRRMLYFNKRTQQRTFEKPQSFMNMLELARDESSAINTRGADNTHIVALLGQEKKRELASVAMFEHDKPEDQRTGFYDKITEKDKLTPKNKGYMMLLKMGWKKDTGLGKTFEGIKEPISINVHDHQIGLGKKKEYEEHNSVAAKERKKLEIEREETPELLKERKERKARLEDIHATLTEQNRKFYCKLCDKQYKNAMQIQSHLSSYDHHHTKRLKDMKERERRRGGDEKLNKERAREERQLRKLMAQANKARTMREKLVAQPPLPPHEPKAPQPPLPPRPSFSGFSLGSKKKADGQSVVFSGFSFGTKKKHRKQTGFSF